MMIHWSSVALIGGLSLAAQAATIIFPPTSAVRIDIDAMDCNDGSALICLTSIDIQRKYLLAIAGNDAFVTAAYRVLLRRQVDTAGAVYYTNRLNSATPTITRSGVIAELMTSAEYKALHP